MEALDPFDLQDEGRHDPEEGQAGPRLDINLQPFPGFSAAEAAEGLQAFARAMQNPAKTYLDHLQEVADSDVKNLEKAQLNYGDSWKRRGGVGAFMMCARKWDRLENAMTREFAPMVPSGDGGLLPGPAIDRYDILARAAADPRAEGIIDDIRDLRRYLMLIEAELIRQGHGRDEVRK